MLIALAAGAVQAELLTVDDMTFVEIIDQIKSKAFAKDSNLYVQPTNQQQTDFRAVADSLWVAQTDVQLQMLITPAANLGYDVVKLTDNDVVYYGLREQLVGGNQTVGWGSYFVRQGERRDALVQATHPLADTNTPVIAATAYVQSEARGFMIAGAHRNTNGPDTADVAHLTESIFLKVHESWNGPAGENIAWQVHGFDLDNHLDFPTDTDAVLSNGTGAVSPQVVALDAAIEALGAQWVSYAYNTLDVNDPLNVTVNGNVQGDIFGGPNGLAATTNVQQLHSTGIGGQFVHIELEQSFRLNGPAARQLAGDAISLAISQTTTLTAIPEPTTAALGLVGIIALTLRRKNKSRH